MLLKHENCQVPRLEDNIRFYSRRYHHQSTMYLKKEKRVKTMRPIGNGNYATKHSIHVPSFELGETNSVAGMVFSAFFGASSE